MRPIWDSSLRTEDDVRRYLRGRLDAVAVRARPTPRRGTSVGFLALQIVAATVVLLAATTIAVGIRARTEPQPNAASSQATSGGPVGEIDVSGLRLKVPSGWFAIEQDYLLNRRMRRVMVVTPRRDVALPTVGADGNESWSAADDDALVDLREGTGAAVQATLPDTPLPLRLEGADHQTTARYERWTLEFMLGGRPFTLAVYIGAAAPAALRSEAEAVVGSIRLIR